MKAELREEFKEKLKKKLQEAFPGASVVLTDIPDMQYSQDTSVEDVLGIIIRNDAFTSPDELSDEPFLIKAVAGAFQYEWFCAWNDLNDDTSDEEVEYAANVIIVGAMNRLHHSILSKEARKTYLTFIVKAFIEGVKADQEETADE